MYKDKFVLTIIHNGSPVRESGSRSNRKAAIPFGSEYKIRLKNKNNRSCTASITIDGTPVSNFGDIIINAGGTVDLERFITESLDYGKKFKFVELNHPNVDDPTKSDNGIIRAEFRLAKQKDHIKISTKRLPSIDYTGGSSYDYLPFNCNINNSAVYCSSNTLCDVYEGATIEGGKSTQRFTYSNLEVESISTVLKLKIVGIKKTNLSNFQKRYCTYCGYKINKNDRYCAGCGRKL